MRRPVLGQLNLEQGMLVWMEPAVTVVGMEVDHEQDEGWEEVEHLRRGVSVSKDADEAWQKLSRP